MCFDFCHGRSLFQCGNIVFSVAHAGIFTIWQQDVWKRRCRCRRSCCKQGIRYWGEKWQCQRKWTGNNHLLLSDLILFTKGKGLNFKNLRWPFGDILANSASCASADFTLQSQIFDTLLRKRLLFLTLSRRRASYSQGHFLWVEVYTCRFFSMLTSGQSLSDTCISSAASHNVNRKMKCISLGATIFD